MHNSSYISLYVKSYRDVMGGVSKAHPPLRPFQVHPTQNRHPITEGIQPFMVNDEQHYVQYDLDPAHVILESENIDGLTFNGMGTKSVSAWAHELWQGARGVHGRWPQHACDVESAISGGTEAFGALAAAADLAVSVAAVTHGRASAGSMARQGPAPRMRRKQISSIPVAMNG